MIDTSVWIYALRRKPNEAIKEAVNSLLARNAVAITEPITLELLSGFSNRQEKNKLSSRLDILTNFKVGSSTWKLAADLGVSLREKGVSIPYMDLIISAVAIENGVTLIHADTHYELVAKQSTLKTNNFQKFLSLKTSS